MRSSYLLEQPARVRRHGLEVASLRLGVQRAKRQRRLPRAGDPGERHYGVAGDVDVDVAEVVLAGAADAHEVVGLVSSHWPLVPTRDQWTAAHPGTAAGLSHVYRVPLDDLVAAPEEGDPRLRLKPGLVKGRTVIPLTRQPDGVQAWKIIIPTGKATPEPRAHDGHEWIYVLSGDMRFILGDQDVVLGPGEVAAFDTTVPHWFGSTGAAPAEILSIFGRPGERMTFRGASDQT
ncbi:MAG: transcriptional regulator, family [Marmoricola sp.]|nr:transcriptional regulator, family [Marmoricola sp.]